MENIIDLPIEQELHLYRWQRECLSAWDRHGCRGIVQAVTGSGKTRLAVAAIRLLRRRCPSLSIKVVVPTIPLASQWMDILTAYASSEEERPGLVGNGYSGADSRRTRIYIINSARKQFLPDLRSALARDFSVLAVFDECHHYLSKENRTIFAYAGEPYADRVFALGLSATLDAGEMHFPFNALGDTIYSYHAEEAVQDAVVSPYFISNISVPFLPKERREYDAQSLRIRHTLGRLYKQYPYLKAFTDQKQAFMKEVSGIANAKKMDPSDPAAAFLLLTYERKKLCVMADVRICCCLDLIRALPENDRILVFSERIEQAENLQRTLMRHFGSCVGIYHSAITKAARNRILTEYKNHTIRILIACRCLDEGIDVPDANIGIVLSSSSVPRQRIQRLGRILRRAAGKDAACLYYLYLRDSSEDNVYLSPETDRALSSHLRYEPSDGSFRNELYLYTAGVYLSEVRDRLTPGELAELRVCIEEGVTRSDYLLPADILKEKKAHAEDRHARNYWTVMQAIEKRMEIHSQETGK